MSVLASADVEAAVILMRIANVLLFVGLTVALFLLLPRQRKGTLAWAWLISLVPLGMFIIPSNNPSSWAVLSAGTVWLALVGYFESAGLRKAALGTLAVLAAVIGLGARSDAALFIVIGIVVSILITARFTRSYVVQALLPGAIVILAAAVVLAGNPAALAGAGLSPRADQPLENPVALVFGNLLNVPLLWFGAFGSWNLGWLDTSLPGVVAVSSFACFASVAFAGLRAMSWRKAAALAIVGIALWAVPTYVLVQNRVIVGAEVQPRYLLPLVVILAGLAVASRSKPFFLSRFQQVLIVTALTGANAVALHVNIRRYVTGSDVMTINLDHSAEWWWVGAPSPMIVWIGGSIAFGLAVALLSSYANRLNSSLLDANSGDSTAAPQRSAPSSWQR